jgi:LuxR family transcriptional regulator, maltose regulon positive regulatory protein
VSAALGVIEPKLMPPRVHAGMLRRARPLNALDDASGVPLTVLNAGVGYGKTTLARSWCTERPEPVIWLTLDPADDDPAGCGLISRLASSGSGRALEARRCRPSPLRACGSKRRSMR